jgi:hypothetical protein
MAGLTLASLGIPQVRFSYLFRILHLAPYLLLKSSAMHLLRQSWTMLCVFHCLDLLHDCLFT